MTRVLAVALAAVFVMPAGAWADDETEEGEEAAAPKNKSKAADEEAKEEAGGDAKEDDAEAETPEASAAAVMTTGEPSARMTIPGGKILINAIVEANLAKGAAGKPFSIAPDLWFGAGDKLTLGLVHSGRGATGFLTGFGTGLCFRGGGAMGACGRGLGDIYTFVGGEARIGLTEGSFALALPVGIQARAYEPKLVLAAKLGLLGRWQSSKVAIEFGPTLYAGLTQRTIEVDGAKISNNVETFGLPLTLFVKLSDAFAIAAQTGVTFVVKEAGDTYAVPAALGLAWWVSPKFSVDVAFGLAAVVDKNDMTKAFDSRSLTLGVGYGM